jgi:hypothetical protein
MTLEGQNFKQGTVRDTEATLYPMFASSIFPFSW